MYSQNKPQKYEFSSKRTIPGVISGSKISPEIVPRVIDQINDHFGKQNNEFRLLPVGSGSSGHHQKFQGKF